MINRRVSAENSNRKTPKFIMNKKKAPFNVFKRKWFLFRTSTMTGFERLVVLKLIPYPRKKTNSLNERAIFLSFLLFLLFFYNRVENIEADVKQWLDISRYFFPTNPFLQDVTYAKSEPWLVEKKKIYGKTILYKIIRMRARNPLSIWSNR